MNSPTTAPSTATKRKYVGKAAWVDTMSSAGGQAAIPARTPRHRRISLRMRVDMATSYRSVVTSRRFPARS
jgi:hypothetical protein